MAHIKLADLTAEQTTVELFDGHTYNVRTVTRSVQKQLEKVDGALDEAFKGDDSDKTVGVFAEGLAVLLEPVNGSPPVKKMLTDAWKADQISLDQFLALYQTTQQVGVKRPT